MDHLGVGMAGLAARGVIEFEGPGTALLFNQAPQARSVAVHGLEVAGVGQAIEVDPVAIGPLRKGAAPGIDGGNGVLRRIQAPDHVAQAVATTAGPGRGRIGIGGLGPLGDAFMPEGRHGHMGRDREIGHGQAQQLGRHDAAENGFEFAAEAVIPVVADVVGQLVDEGPLGLAFAGEDAAAGQGRGQFHLDHRFRHHGREAVMVLGIVADDDRQGPTDGVARLFGQVGVENLAALGQGP